MTTPLAMPGATTGVMVTLKPTRDKVAATCADILPMNSFGSIVTPGITSAVADGVGALAVDKGLFTFPNWAKKIATLTALTTAAAIQRRRLRDVRR